MPAVALGAVLYEVKDKIAFITLNRPEKMNALNEDLRGGLAEALMDVRQNPDVWVGIITGAGDRAFSSGADLARMEGSVSAARSGAKEAPSADNMYQFIRHTYKPLIAAVNGYALAAGAGIALSCDIRILSDRAQLGWPHARRGITSTSGPCLLAHLVPINIAMEIEFYAEFLSAQRCLELQLANAVVPHEELMSAAIESAEKIKANAPLSLRGIKQVAYRGLDLTMDERVKVAGEIGSQVRLSEDTKEGLRAFNEKRAPVWQGR